MRKPIIGISSNVILQAAQWTPNRRDKFVRLHLGYYQAIARAGGIPLIIPPIGSHDEIKHILKKIDGLLISGGDDLAPRIYRETPLPQMRLIDPVKQKFDLALVKLATRQKIPILGICYGIQLLNVSFGGSLFQDLPSQLKGLAPHRQRHHRVYFGHGHQLNKIYGTKSLQVNSYHHQAIKKLGRNLIANAQAEDGIIEGIESAQRNHFLIGVQWHPERMLHHRSQLKLFQAFITAASR